MATSLLNLAQLYRRTGRQREAEPLLKHAADILDQTAGPYAKVRLVCVHTVVSIYICLSIYLCVRACVRACVCACARVRARAHTRARACDLGDELESRSVYFHRNVRLCILFFQPRRRLPCAEVLFPGSFVATHTHATHAEHMHTHATNFIFSFLVALIALVDLASNSDVNNGYPDPNTCIYHFILQRKHAKHAEHIYI